MTTKIKENLIKISRKEKTKWVVIILMLITAVLIFREPEKVHLVIIFMLLSVFSQTIARVREKGEEFVIRNKILNIVLSQEETVVTILHFGVIIPILSIVKLKNTIINFLILVCVLVIMLLTSKVIAKIFQKKLIN